MIFIVTIIVKLAGKIHKYLVVSIKNIFPQIVKDNLFPYKIPEITRGMIDVFVVIKIPD